MPQQTTSKLEGLVNDFVVKLVSLIEIETTVRLQSAITNALGGLAGPPRRGPGRPPKLSVPLSLAAIKRKLPPQLCPVPGCKGVAAPIFGMVCSQHKNMPKAQIKKYREERRAKQLAQRKKTKAA